MEKPNSIQWIPVIELAVLAFTTLGTTITLFLHSESKIESVLMRSEDNRKEVVQIIQSIQLEMKDFHGRLCAIEEGRKNKGQ